MDIQISSNFERLLFDLYGRDGKALADAMADFRSTGTLKVGANALGGVRELFDAGRLDDEGTLAAIADCRKRFGETLDPHTAVGYAVAQQHRRDPTVPMVVLATAHPAKFPDAVQKATGERPRAAGAAGRPAASAPSGSTACRNDIEALKDLIDDRMARAHAAARGCAHERRQGHHPGQRPARRGRRDARGRIGLARHLGRLRHAPRDRPS